MCLRAIVTILKILIRTINKNTKQSQDKDLDDKVETFKKNFSKEKSFLGSPTPRNFHYRRIYMLQSIYIYKENVRGSSYSIVLSFSRLM
jgi:hypothetical protein